MSERLTVPEVLIGKIKGLGFLRMLYHAGAHQFWYEENGPVPDVDSDRYQEFVDFVDDKLESINLLDQSTFNETADLEMDLLEASSRFLKRANSPKEKLKRMIYPTSS